MGVHCSFILNKKLDFGNGNCYCLVHICAELQTRFGVASLTNTLTLLLDLSFALVVKDSLLSLPVSFLLPVVLLFCSCGHTHFPFSYPSSCCLHHFPHLKKLSHLTWLDLMSIWARHVSRKFYLFNDTRKKKTQTRSVYRSVMIK